MARPDLRLVQPRSINGRPPPHDIEAEGVVLSAILTTAGARLDDVCSELVSGDFYSEAHQRIFEAILAVRARNAEPDIRSVSIELRDRGRIEQVGGLEYLTEILGSADAVTPRRVEYFVRIVRERALLREMIATCQRVAAEGYFDVGSIGEFLRKSATDIEEISRKSETKTVESNVESLRRLVNRMQSANARAHEHGGIVGVRTGIFPFDWLTKGLLPKKLYVVAARPGCGKSLLAFQAAANIAENGFSAHAFSMEMSRDEVIERLTSYFAEVDGEHITTGELSEVEWARVSAAMQKIYSLPLTIDEDRELSGRQLRARALKAIETARIEGRPPIGVFIVDYIQWMSPPAGMERAPKCEYVGENAKQLKLLASETGIPVLALAQLNRQVDERAGGKVCMPRKSDIADSSAIEKHADVIGFIHRDAKVIDNKEELVDNDGKALLIVDKNRGGREGVLPLTMQGQYMRFVTRRAS